MTKLPKAVSEAATPTLHLSSDIARRVILALVESLPEKAVKSACVAWFGDDTNEQIKSYGTEAMYRMRAAIIAALKDIAGEKENASE